MAKRRAVPSGSDEESHHSSKASKRARNGDYDEPPVAPKGKKDKGKGKQVVPPPIKTDGEDLTKLDQGLYIDDISRIVPEEDDEAFEAKHGKAIEEAVKDRERKKGVCLEQVL